MLATLISDCLKTGRTVRFRASGRSMYPTNRANKRVLVTPVSPACISLGDIVLTRSGEKITAHRLVRLDEETAGAGQAQAVCSRSLYVLRGDACSRCDPPVTAHQILGKVVAIERRGWTASTYSRAANLPAIFMPLPPA